MSRSRYLSNLAIRFLILIGLGVAVPVNSGCTESDPTVGGSQEALSGLTPLQEAWCTWGSCKEGVPKFEPEVEKAFADDFQKNGGAYPEPEQVDYNSDGTVLRIKLCFPDGGFTNPADWECVRVGCGCDLCEKRNCYTIGYGSAHYAIEVGGTCQHGTVGQSQDGSFYCKVGGGGFNQS